MGIFSLIFADPYAKISFENQCQITRVIKQTVCPEWDQTLIFEDIQMYGSPSTVAESAPYVNIELFDKDQVVRYHLSACMFFEDPQF